MREHFVSALVEEVLGPRQGLREVLHDSPMSEYIAGVLAPEPSELFVRDLDADAVLPVVEDGRGELDEDALDAEPPPVRQFAPVLDPQGRPRSLGISFVVTAEGPSGTVNICATWARYLENAPTPGSRPTWTREPRFAVLRGIPITGYTLFLDASGHPSGQGNAEVSVQLVSRALPHNPRYLTVSIYLVNRLPVPGDGFATTTHHLFQPQIRVVCGPGTRMVAGLESQPRTEDDRLLRFLYRNRPVLARGHLCSAVWKDVDYETTPHPADAPPAPHRAPFLWTDAALLSEVERAEFCPADARTEYVPMHSVLAPELRLDLRFGGNPELRAERLAQLWDPADIRGAFEPLVNGYHAWIVDLQAIRVEPDDQPIAADLIRRCQDAASRIAGGINLLIADPEVRLAFCFAMQAIAIQARWTKADSGALEWRPFQLAFVLMTLESITNPASADREICDLLWVPTGAGKTEAYLALAAFTMAYRRRRVLRREGGDRTGAGVCVLSRYTLRLLTIQQFRRALRIVTACELLRVHGLGTGGVVGWRPVGCRDNSHLLWGSTRFSAGLWVGGGVTPNRMEKTWSGRAEIPGALEILQGAAGEGEPAQVLRCPVCDTLLSIPHRSEDGLPAGTYQLHLVVRGAVTNPGTAVGAHGPLEITAATVQALPGAGYYTLTLNLNGGNNRIVAEDVDTLWAGVRATIGNPDLVAARASRPGYFLRAYGGQNRPIPYDFEVICPSPECELRHPWFEGSPSGWTQGGPPNANAPAGDQAGIPHFSDGNRLGAVLEPFRAGSPYLADRVPIPACTVDEQVYSRCPSLVIATVDKFARPPFEPRASALFGNVDHHHCVRGYYRFDGQHRAPVGRSANNRNYRAIPPLDSPDLVLQDELHLIEGPLGSLVGLYETAVDRLARPADGQRVKYIASTATVRQAEDQVRSVFDRGLMQFPPPGLTVDDSFFIRFERGDLLDDTLRGRLYMGIAAPGKGPLTPVLRIWARLLQTAWERRTAPDVDGFWTLAGYFNAIRELAGARALYRQDIPERLGHIGGAQSRPIPEEQSQELSGRSESTQLPTILDALNTPLGQDAVFATSMFGTGVDVPRLALMVVHGQPKSTSAYIQATGRVGRERGALVVTFLRATRPRDLNHYEFFLGYHLQMHRFVEPVTVMPFAPGVLDRGCGPVGVFILRNRRGPQTPWHQDGSAPEMRSQRYSAEVDAIPGEMEARAANQPPERRPGTGVVATRSQAALDRWWAVAQQYASSLEYVEYGTPLHPVVLGDPAHLHSNLPTVYRNAPTSLRDIEETCGFQTTW